MREILFRGKRVDNDEWVFGLPSYDMNGNLEEIEVHRGFCNCGTFEVDPETVCQYTGLTDKNGRKIFEGDIVKTKYYGKDSENGCNFNDCDVFVIDYGEATFRLDNKERRFFLTKLKDIEIIGNIFDNPELI